VGLFQTILCQASSCSFEILDFFVGCWLVLPRVGLFFSLSFLLFWQFSILSSGVGSLRREIFLLLFVTLFVFLTLFILLTLLILLCFRRVWSFYCELVVFVHLCMKLSVSMYVCVCMCVSVCVCMCMCVCVCVCVCASMYETICTYVCACV